MQSQFLFFGVNPGTERFLKDELKSRLPGLHPAYGRPGFLTVKNAGDKPYAPDMKLPVCFRRCCGLCFGRIDRDGLPEAVAALVREFAGKSDFRLHVFPRDTAITELAENLSQAEAEIRQTCPGIFHSAPEARAGDLVIDVAGICENEFWLGLHRHHSGHSPFAGGYPPLAETTGAPSRGYLKMREALLVTGGPMMKGQTVAELGAAPGGASLCLLEAGMNVLAVDPAEMDPVCAALAGPNWFRHLKRQAGKITAADLGTAVDWLVLDINAHPAAALADCARFLGLVRPTVRGCFLTLKMNSMQVASQLPKFLKKIQDLGLRIRYAGQLAASHQEVFIYGTFKVRPTA